MVSHFLDLVDEADQDKNGKIDFGEWEVMGMLPNSGFIVGIRLSSVDYINSDENQTSHSDGW